MDTKGGGSDKHDDQDPSRPSSSGPAESGQPREGTQQRAARVEFGELYETLFIEYRPQGDLEQTLSRIQLDARWPMTLSPEMIRYHYQHHQVALETAYAQAILARLAGARAIPEPPRPDSLSAPANGPAAVLKDDVGPPPATAASPSASLPLPTPSLSHPSGQDTSPSVLVASAVSPPKVEPVATPQTKAEPSPTASPRPGPSRSVPEDDDVANDRRSTSRLTSPPRLSETPDAEEPSSDSEFEPPPSPQTSRPLTVKGKGKIKGLAGEGRSASSTPFKKRHPVPGGADRDSPLRPPRLRPPPPVLAGADQSLDHIYCHNCGYRKPDNYTRPWRNWTKAVWFTRLSDQSDHPWPERSMCHRCCMAFYVAVWREAHPKSGEPHKGGRKMDVSRVRTCRFGLNAVAARRRTHFMGDIRHRFGDRTLSLPHDGGPIEDLERIEAVSDSVHPAGPGSMPNTDEDGLDVEGGLLDEEDEVDELDGPNEAPPPSIPVAPVSAPHARPASSSSASSSVGQTNRRTSSRRSIGRPNYADAAELSPPPPPSSRPPSSMPPPGFHPDSAQGGPQRKRSRSVSPSDSEGASPSSQTAKKKRTKGPPVHPKKPQRPRKIEAPPPPSSDTQWDERLCFICGWRRPVCPEGCKCKKWGPLSDEGWFMGAEGAEDFAHTHRIMCMSCMYKCYDGIHFNDTTHPKNGKGWQRRLPPGQTRPARFGVAELMKYRARCWMGDLKHDAEDWASIKDFQSKDIVKEESDPSPSVEEDTKPDISNDSNDTSTSTIDARELPTTSSPEDAQMDETASQDEVAAAVLGEEQGVDASIADAPPLAAEVDETEYDSEDLYS